MKKKKRYRCLSVLLACGLVLVGLFVGWVAKAETTTTYTMKEDFEDDTMSSADYGSVAFSLYDSTVSGNDSANVHGGSKSLQMVAAGGMKTYASDEHIKLESGKTYQISFWYKAIANTVDETDYQDKALFYFGLSTGDTDKQYLWETSGEWRLCTAVYTVTGDSAYPQFVTYGHPTGAFTIYLDDIEAKEQFTVTADSDGHGTATVNDLASATVYKGDTATYVAVPESGYSFVGWKDDSGELISTDMTFEYEVVSDYNLTAYFTKIICQVEGFESGIKGTNDTMTSGWSIYEKTSGSDSGTSSDDIDIDMGNSTAESDDNVHGGSYSLKGVAIGAWSTYIPNTNINLESGKTYQISFWYKSTKVDSLEQTAALMLVAGMTDVNGSQSNLGYFYNTDGEWTNKTVKYTTSAEATNPCVKFASYNLTEGSYTIYIDDIEVKEQFELIAENDGNGSATTMTGGTAATTAFAYDTVTYVATPNSNYVFENWTDENGNVVSTEASYTTTVEGDITLTAHFTEAKAVNVKGATVRTDGSCDIRFEAEFVDLADKYEVKNVGVILIPTSYLDTDETLTLDTKNAAIQRKAFSVFDVTEPFYVNLRNSATENNLNKTFTIRAFVELTDGKVIYSEMCARSCVDVAKALVAEYEITDENITTIVSKIEAWTVSEYETIIEACRAKLQNVN